MILSTINASISFMYFYQKTEIIWQLFQTYINSENMQMILSCSSIRPSVMLKNFVVINLG